MSMQSSSIAPTITTADLNPAQPPPSATLRTVFGGFRRTDSVDELHAPMSSSEHPDIEAELEAIVAEAHVVAAGAPAHTVAGEQSGLGARLGSLQRAPSTELQTTAELQTELQRALSSHPLGPDSQSGVCGPACAHCDIADGVLVCKDQLRWSHKNADCQLACEHRSSKLNSVHRCTNSQTAAQKGRSRSIEGPTWLLIAM